MLKVPEGQLECLSILDLTTWMSRHQGDNWEVHDIVRWPHHPPQPKSQLAPHRAQASNEATAAATTTLTTTTTSNTTTSFPLAAATTDGGVWPIAGDVVFARYFGSWWPAVVQPGLKRNKCGSHRGALRFFGDFKLARNSIPGWTLRPFDMSTQAEAEADAETTSNSRRREEGALLRAALDDARRACGMEVRLQPRRAAGRLEDVCAGDVVEALWRKGEWRSAMVREITSKPEGDKVLYVEYLCTGGKIFGGMGPARAREWLTLDLVQPTSETVATTALKRCGMACGFCLQGRPTYDDQSSAVGTHAMRDNENGARCDGDGAKGASGTGMKAGKRRLLSVTRAVREFGENLSNVH